MIGKLLKGIVKTVIGKSTKKAGMDDGRSKNILDLADDLIDNDEEIQNQIHEFLTNFEGKYTNLKTKAEGIVRSMLRPFLTIFFSTNAMIMIYLKIPIPQLVTYCTIVLVVSWTGTKAFRDWKKAKKK